MKRFMADFISTDAGKLQRQQHQQPKTDHASTGVAFVSPEKKMILCVMRAESSMKAAI